MNQLLRLEYQDENITLKDFYFSAQNLIVGKNASGKSRVLSFLKEFLSDRDKIDNYTSTSEFLHNDEIYTYHIESHNSQLKRKLYLGENFLYEFNDAGATFYNENGNIVDSVNWKHNFKEIIISSHPIKALKFANLLPQNQLINKDTDKLSTIPIMPDLLNGLRLSSLEKVRQELISIGYEVDDFVIQNSNIFVIDKNIPKPLGIEQISQGMFRSLVLLLYLEFLAKNEPFNLLLIDDLCEGLDFERAGKLGKLIFKKAKEANFQLIATTNDGFLMDAVPFECFSVLQKDGNTLSLINEKSQPDLAERFEFLGSTNFDFFSSNFIDNHLKHRKKAQ